MFGKKQQLDFRTKPSFLSQITELAKFSIEALNLRSQESAVVCQNHKTQLAGRLLIAVEIQSTSRFC